MTTAQWLPVDSDKRGPSSDSLAANLKLESDLSIRLVNNAPTPKPEMGNRYPANVEWRGECHGLIVSVWHSPTGKGG